MNSKNILVGGEINPNLHFYCRRTEDKEIREFLNRENQIIYLVAPRQSGKSSLIANLFSDYKGSGIITINVDLSGIIGGQSPAGIEDYEEWVFNKILFEICKKLELSIQSFQSWFREQIALKHSYINIISLFFTEFVRLIIPKETRIILAIDELDTLSKYVPCYDFFCLGLQSFSKKLHSTNISIITASIIHPSLKLVEGSDIKSGIYLKINDFQENETTILQWINIIPDESNINDSAAFIKEVFSYTNGHPLLTCLIINSYLNNDGYKLEEIVEKVIKKDDKFFKYGLKSYFSFPDSVIRTYDSSFIALKFYLELLTENNISLEGLDKDLTVLFSAGLITLLTEEKVTFRNYIYKLIYNIDWAEELLYDLEFNSFDSPIRSPEYSRIPQRKIAIINIGGTIGMLQKDGKIKKAKRIEFEKRFYTFQRFPSTVTILDYLEPKDGCNIFPEDWIELSKLIYKKRNDFQGFVVLSGTDTMAYTASAVAFALGAGLDFPVVFVGAQAPGNVFYGDAEINLLRAVKVASLDIPEVVVCFGNKVFRAVRAEKKDDYNFEGFHSPTIRPLAIINEKIELNEKEISQDRSGVFELKNEFEKKILQVTQYPGFQPEWILTIIETQKDIKGVIIQSLGIGNLPHKDPIEYNFIPIIHEIKKNFEIPVVITSKYPINPEFVKNYVPATAPILAGAIHARNMTSAAALVKFMWLLPQIEKDLNNRNTKQRDKLIEFDKRFRSSYIGEIDDIEIKFIPGEKNVIE